MALDLVSATAFPTIFRLAETVEENSFKNLAEAEKLRVRLCFINRT